jgi:hypothetical protein
MTVSTTQRIVFTQASTNEFPVPDALPNSDLVAALPRLRRYARVLTGDVHRADDLL